MRPEGERFRSRGWAVARFVMLARTRTLLGIWTLVVLAGAGIALAARGPADLAARYTAGTNPAGELVRDARGRPVLLHGKPLRVGPDGRTVVDSRGRPVRGRDGRVLRVSGDGRLSPDAAPRRRHAPDRRRPRRRSERRARPRARQPVATATPDARPIVVGLAHMQAESYNRVAQAQGAALRIGEAVPQAEAVIAHINSTGGIAGRPVELRAHEYDRMDHRGLAVELAEACADFRDGPRPVVVLQAGGEDLRDLGACLREAGIPYLFNWPVGPDRQAMAELGTHSFGTGTPGIDRVQRPYVEEMAASGFFRDARVGVLLPERGESDRRAGDLLLAALRDHGVEPVAQARMDFPDSVSYLGDYIARIGDAVLRFRARGVDRVVSVEFGGETTGLFMKSARTQDWFPDYGLSSAHAPNLLAVSGQAMYGNSKSVIGSVAIGWAPALDVEPGDEPQTATRRACDGVYARAGVDVGTRTPAGLFSALHICDSLLALRRAIESGNGDTSVAAVRGGFEGLGGAFDSGLTLGTLLGPSRHDGATRFRPLRFATDCGCFRYTGPERSF